MAQAPLIMFDGPDGTGKSTQLALAQQSLESQGQNVFATHMLGGSPIGDMVREVIFSDAGRSAETNLHLCLAAYYALLEVVEDKCDQGYTVLLDRSPLSIIAYQVYGDGLNLQDGMAACGAALKAFMPSAVLVYEAPANTLVARRQQREKADDYFEKMLNDYHERTQEGYSAAAKAFAAAVISAEADIDAVHEETMRIIDAVDAAPWSPRS